MPFALLYVIAVTELIFGRRIQSGLAEKPLYPVTASHQLPFALTDIDDIEAVGHLRHTALGVSQASAQLMNKPHRLREVGGTRSFNLGGSFRFCRNRRRSSGSSAAQSTL